MRKRGRHFCRKKNVSNEWKKKIFLSRILIKKNKKIALSERRKKFVLKVFLFCFCWFTCSFVLLCVYHKSEKEKKRNDFFFLSSVQYIYKKRGESTEDQYRIVLEFLKKEKRVLNYKLLNENQSSFCREKILVQRKKEKEGKKIIEEGKITMINKSSWLILFLYNLKKRKKSTKKTQIRFWF